MQRHVLHAGLDRRALPGDWSAASSTPGTNSRATATSTIARAIRATANFSPTSAWPRRCSRTSPGHAVKGYRAPSFSIGAGNPWAFDCIAEAGYRYSSSIYPIRHDHYGVPDAPRFAHEVRPGLLEVPVATVRMLRANWPAGGGGYFRLLPYAVSRWSIRRVNAIDGKPAMFYFHPWELDPEQPRVNGRGRKARFRHYVNLQRMESALAPPACATSAGIASTGSFLSGGD